MYKKFFKRLIDIFVALIACIVACIPMLFIAIAIKLDSKRPVIFKRKRIGKNKKPFMILKFRTIPQL